MAFNDGIKVGPIAYIGLVSVIVTFALVLMLQVVYYQQTKQMRDSDFATEGPPAELTDLTSKQQTELTQRGYVDQQQGIVSVGIERAKELVVTELAQGKAPSEVNGPPRLVAPAAQPPAAAGQPAAETTQPQTTQPQTTQPQTTQPAPEPTDPATEKQEPNDGDKS